MVARYQVQQLADLPIESVASRLGMEVIRHRSLCPFHDDTHPSLTFDIRHNRYRCFVCGEYGNPIDLVMKKLHLPFPEACRWLADEGNIILQEEVQKPRVKEEEKRPFDASRYARFFEHPFISEAASHFLYTERRLDPRVVRWCRLTSWRDQGGTDWLQIPYYDTEGKLTGIQNRNLGHSQPRFRFPTGSRCAIYNLPVLGMLREGEPLYITEGCSDCWAILSSGHKAIAIPSATLLKEADVQLLSSLHARLSTQFHMYPDQDMPGEQLFLQLRKALQKQSPGLTLTRHQLPQGCKDYAEYYVRGDSPMIR